MIIGFSGSRRLRPHQCTSLVLPILRELDPDHDFVVVGDAMGLDKFVLDWCRDNKFSHALFYARWDRHDRAAGPIRNRRMSAMIEKLYAFPGPESRGTIDMIEQCEKEPLCQEIVVTEVSR